MTPVPTQLVALVFQDDTVGIMSFVLEDKIAGWAKEASAENIEKEIQRSAFEKDKTPIKSWRLISPSDLPPTREFRLAWRENNGKLVEDIVECRKIYKNHIRESRKLLLEALDIEYQIADEQENKVRKREIAQEKQRLRDATDDPRIEAARTVEELKVINLLIRPTKKKG
jgi:hypothetical protein